MNSKVMQILMWALITMTVGHLSLATAQEVPAELISWPDSIYTNAIIVTLDEHELNDDPGTIAEAMAIHDGSILDYYIATSNGQIKLFYTSIMGLALLTFTITGFWLWYGPKRMRKRTTNR